MPTYHYRCTSCGHEFDQFQKFSDDPLTECPDCHQRIKRVIGNVGVVFKGSGWYITDSRKPSESTSNGTTAKTEPKEPAAATAESKSDPKPEKTETKPETKSKTESASKVAAAG